MAARDPGGEEHAKVACFSPQDFARPFFSRVLHSRLARRTKRKREYSWSNVWVFRGDKKSCRNIKVTVLSLVTR